MIYLVTLPGCKMCAERREQLAAQQRTFQEIDGRDMHHFVDGSAVPKALMVEALTELAANDWRYPTQFVWPRSETERVQ